MVEKIFKTLLILIFTALIIGCATIMNGTDQVVRINSKPRSATVKIYDSMDRLIWDSQTPTTVVLKRGNGYFKKAVYRVEIKKEGYKKKEILLEGTMDLVWYMGGNIASAGFPGWFIIDPMTGAMWTLSPQEIDVSLSREVSFLNPKEGLMVVLLDQVPENLLDALEPVPLN